MTAVATVPERKGIAALIASPEATARITPFLPKGVDIERVIAAAQLAVMQVPALAECDPKSIVLSCAKIAQWGLDIGTTAHLVPFGKTCTPVPDYRGLVEMIVRSGAARHVEARVVREGDDFKYAYGTNKFIEHTPRTKSSAKITHAYAIVTLRFQHFDFIVLDRDEIEAVRAKSKQWSRGNLEDHAWYAKKTAVRRVVNLIPKNAALAATLSSVVETEREVEGEFALVPPDRDPDGPVAGEFPASVDPETGEDLAL
jgi:recombination protein RecT